MKKLLALILLCCLSAQAGWLHITDWRNYPGARQKGQCMIYAKAVCDDLSGRKMAAHELRYRWQDKKGESGRHAMVLFQYSGEWFLVENEKTDPVNVTRFANAQNGWSPKSMLRAVQSFSRHAYEIYYVD